MTFTLSSATGLVDPRQATRLTPRTAQGLTESIVDDRFIATVRPIATGAMRDNPPVTRSQP